MTLPREPAADEPIARFLTSSSHFRREARTVREGAFLPRPPACEVSVFRVRSLTPDRILALGKESGPDVKRIFGYGQITVEDVTAVALAVQPAEPPPRHADIVGWPQDPDPALNKARQLAIAKRLARRATLNLEE